MVTSLILDESVVPFFEDMKRNYLEKVKNGYRAKEIKQLRALGMSDDSIFLGEMLGLYKAWSESFLSKIYDIKDVK